MPKIIDKSSKIFSKKYISLITLIPLLLGIALSILFKDFNFQELLSSDAVITAPDILGISAPNVMSFQGRLTDRSDTPITAPTSVTFKIYNVPSGGTALWTGTCSLTPDGDGIFDALLGSECGSAIPDTVFGENVDTYLGITVGSDTEMTPRQKIVSSAYALNADTLDGFDSSQTPGVNNVVVLDTSGNLTFGITNPVISSSGDIVLSPTDNLGVGTTNPLFRTHIVESGATGEASSILTGGDTGKALVIQGNGGAFISGRDVTNNVEYLLGTASGSSVFMGSATAHNLSFRTNNLDRIVIQGSNGYFGIGDLSPASLFTVGNGDLFQVNSSGDLIKIKNVTYSWPSSNGSGVLTNNGSGT
ncbi:hypothetical protein GX618_00740, partial [Candidatus Dojkabacteria bacterium]|nr:hypothetical protein [Candidatus Dojkabacteria bacterium]